jgi:hypothetical protein
MIKKNNTLYRQINTNDLFEQYVYETVILRLLGIILL